MTTRECDYCTAPAMYESTRWRYACADCYRALDLSLARDR